MTNATTLSRAYVNDGGDIALHLAPNESFSIGMIDRPDNTSLFGTARIAARAKSPRHSHQPLRGRSFCLGRRRRKRPSPATAAQADAAATIIANAPVDLPGHPRSPASQQMKSPPKTI